MADLLNWAIIGYEKFLLADGFLFKITTDSPCHLFLRYTTIEPQIHTEPVLRRGIYMHGQPRFCFVAWKQNEQSDAGDTIIHYFFKQNWKECETRWFYFVGTKGGIQSPSTSPIMELHFGYILASEDGAWGWRLPINANFDQYAVFEADKLGAVEHALVKLSRRGEPGEVTFEFHNLLSTGLPDPHIIHSAKCLCTGMPEIPFADWKTLQFKATPISETSFIALRASCPAIPPVSAYWEGIPNHPTGRSYIIQHRLYDNWWHTFPFNQFYYLMRGPYG